MTNSKMVAQPHISLRISEDQLIEKLHTVKAWIFDWDGVFNDGHKDAERQNSFSERDSMGTNMLRYAHYLRNGNQPYCAIITGATNPTPQVFAQREHFHAIVPGSLYKRDVVEHLLTIWNTDPSETAFFYDDILDLNVCEIAGLRIQVRYPSSAAFNAYVDENDLADVVCTLPGAAQAIRCVSDYFIALLNQTHDVIHGRMHLSDSYKTYFDARQQIETAVFTRAEFLAENLGK